MNAVPFVRAILIAAPLGACVPGGATPPAQASETAARGATVGAAAPDFTLSATDGTSVHLKDLRGSTVVLEWFNPDCPFVRYAHDAEGPLADLGDTWNAKDGVVWLAINSGAEGKQGHGLERNQAARTEWSLDHAVLLDPAGTVGHAYGAKTTPQMVVIDAEGIVRYTGGLDDAPLGKAPGGAPTPYFAQALAAVVNGKPVATPSTKPYGCSVKY